MLSVPQAYINITCFKHLQCYRQAMHSPIEANIQLAVKHHNGFSIDKVYREAYVTSYSIIVALSDSVALPTLVGMPPLFSRNICFSQH